MIEDDQAAAPIWPLTHRLAARIDADFPPATAGWVKMILERIDFGDWKTPSTPDGRERVLAAIVLLSKGDRARFDRAVARADRDRRDVLVGAELAQPDWPGRVDAALGPASNSPDEEPGS